MRWTVDLLLFTWTAGMLDGLSYLRGHVFTANMTGNTVLLGLNLVQGHFGPFRHNLTALCGFAAGCLVAALIFDQSAPPRTARNLVLAARIELPLLVAFAGLWLTSGQADSLGYATIALAAAALGIQSVAVRRMQINGISTTFITGTITETAVEITRVLRARIRTGGWPPRSSTAAVFLILLGIYLVAAITAGYLALHWATGAAILCLPAPIVVMVRPR